MDDFYYLNDAEKAAVDNFVKNKVMREAVRKVLLSGIYQDGVMNKGRDADVTKNFILGALTTPQARLLSAEQKGNFVDAIINGLSLVQTGFEQLEKLKKVTQLEPSKKNPGA